MPARAKVIVHDGFDSYSAAARAATERALGSAASVGVSAARSAPTRYRIGGIQGTVHAEPARGDRRMRALVVPIVARDFRAVFFELGTLGRRRRKLKRPRSRPAPPGSGIRPQRYLALGLRRAKEQLPRLLEREIRSLR